MSLQTYYEWTAEHEDEHGDIQDSDFAERLADLASHRAEGWAIGLVRDTSRDFDTEGTEARTWAYPDADGKLPEFFEDGARVPARFHKEWAANPAPARSQS